MAENNIRTMAQNAREAFLQLSSIPLALRNSALIAIGDSIQRHQGSILRANQQDVAVAQREALARPLLNRLTLTPEKCAHMVEGLRAVASLPDPLGHVQYAKELAEGLQLYRVSCPIGVVGVIFESRPDALVQISSLCLKSGNAVLLKGGREALQTNEALYRAMIEATDSLGIPRGWCGLLQSRQDVADMLRQDDCIDLIIPRGSNAFVRHIMENSNIPVLGHADGVCHVYVDNPCDFDMAVAITVDSKTQNLSVCNAAETLLVHSQVAELFLPRVADALAKRNVSLRGDARTQAIIHCQAATEADWRTEYLDAILAIRVVDSLEEAASHVNTYGSGHTDVIVSSDATHAQQFMGLVDSAGVYHNCSTRFADGYLYGLGAEVGIATGKLHARGPMGLEGLCTYKYQLHGQGHTLQGINDGRWSLTHKDIDS